MPCVDCVEALEYRSLEFLMGRVVAAIEAVLFDELPEAFDQVEIRRIRREKHQGNPALGGVGHYLLAMLVPGVVEHEGQGVFGMQFPQLVEQVTDALCVDIGMVDDADELATHGVDRAQDVEALTACRRPNEGTPEAPDHGEKSSVDEVCRINKIDLALAGLSLIQHGVQFTFLKIACRCGLAFPGIGESRRGAMPKWRRKVRT